MRVLITGALGFIGVHLVQRFRAIGWDVTPTDKIDADVTTDDIAERIFEGQFDGLIHLAAQTDVRASVRDPAHDARTNILGTLNVISAVARLSPQTRVVLASSGGAIYGHSPANELSDLTPQSPYGISKLAAEHYLNYYQRTAGVSTISLRLANVYGPGQTHGLIASFCRQLLAGRPIMIYGDGTQTRDFVFIDDVVRAFEIAVCSKRATGGAFNIGSGESVSVLEIAQRLGAVRREFLPPRAGEQQHCWLDIGKAHRMLRWEPKVSLSVGLGQALDWYSAHTSQGEAWQTASASSA